MIHALLAIDWHAVLELLGAAYVGVTMVLVALRGLLAILERAALSTDTDDDDEAIHAAIRVVDAAQWFVGRWAGRLSLVRPRK